jgi:DNA-directed RNA polymerase subunit RPC12/RpoP
MSETTHLKITCERCGEHIEYPSETAGQSIQCPACQHTIKLPSPPPPEPPSAPAFTTATANMIFHVGRDGMELGQFSEQEFRDKISAGEIRPYDHYWTQRMDDWQLVSEYRRLPSSPGPPTLPPLRRMPEKKKKGWIETPASIGGACALVAAFAPLVSPAFFFLLSLPLLFAAFVLAIVSLVRGRVTGGICLLIGLFPAFMMAFVSVTDRDKILNRQPIETRSTP